MPGYDRTGPAGQGPMTGGGHGCCTENGRRRSAGNGMGQGFCRSGRKGRMGRQGFGMGFGRGFRSGFPDKIPQNQSDSQTANLVNSLNDRKE